MMGDGYGTKGTQMEATVFNVEIKDRSRRLDHYFEVSDRSEGQRGTPNTTGVVAFSDGINADFRSRIGSGFYIVNQATGEIS